MHVYCYELNGCVPLSLYMETRNPIVAVFGDKASKEGRKVQSGHEHGALILLRRINRELSSLFM